MITDNLLHFYSNFWLRDFSFCFLKKGSVYQVEKGFGTYFEYQLNELSSFDLISHLEYIIDGNIV